MPSTIVTTGCSGSMGSFSFERPVLGRSDYVTPGKRWNEDPSGAWRGRPAEKLASQSSSGRYVPPHMRAPGAGHISNATTKAEHVQRSVSPETSWSPSSSAPSSRRGSSSSDASAASSTSSGHSPLGRATQSKTWWNSDHTSPKRAEPRPGNVFLLGGDEEVSKDSVFRNRVKKRGDNPWNHPAVVLESNSKKGLSLCCLATSFHGSKDLKHKRPHERLKIALCDNQEGIEAHEGTRILTMEPGSDKFRKATFINFYDGEGDRTFWIENRNLKPWSTRNGKPITFDRESLERIRNSQVR